MNIRPIVAADLEAVKLLADAIPEAPHWESAVYRAYLESETGPQRRIFVAEDSGELAGFIAGQITFDICELESIVVDSDHRRAGVGSALLAALAAWAGESSVLKVQLEVRSANRSAISFYEGHRFCRDGVRRGYYRQPDDDALLMSLILRSGSNP